MQNGNSVKAMHKPKMYVTNCTNWSNEMANV